MEGFLSSVCVVTLAEMGDKTQLLALALASRFRRPWTVMLGILLATLINHFIAAWVGALVSGILTPKVMGWILGISFLGFAWWTLKPDELGDADRKTRWGPLVTTAVLFFIAEMGDKTQFATMALGARFPATGQVVAGTTLGMLIADGLAVALGEGLGQKVPIGVVRTVAAGLFAILGVVTLVGVAFPAVLPPALI